MNSQNEKPKNKPKTLLTFAFVEPEVFEILKRKKSLETKQTELCLPRTFLIFDTSRQIWMEIHAEHGWQFYEMLPLNINQSCISEVRTFNHIV